MAIRIVRLGTPRAAGEGLRLGTVRRPPRGVPAAKFASEDWYDLWFPELSPSAELFRAARAARTPAEWAAFARRFRREMATPTATRILALLAALSRTTAFSIGCYCAREERCHRGILRALLLEHGASIAD